MAARLRRRPDARTGSGSSAAGLVGYTFAAFVLAAIVLEFARGTRARKALGERTWPAAFASLVARNRRRYGGYVVHAAIALLVIGAVGIGAFHRDVAGRLEPGRADAGRATTRSRYVGLDDRSGSRTARSSARDSTVSRGGETLGVVAAGKNRYFAEGEQPIERGRRSAPTGCAPRTCS